MDGPVIIVGAQRSGTSWVARMLAAHAEALVTVNGKLLYYLLTWIPDEPRAGRHLRLDEIAFSLLRKPIGGISSRDVEHLIATLGTAFPPERFARMDRTAIVRTIWLESYAALATGKRLRGDKYNEYLLHLAAVESIFPDCRYVFVHRHPLAVAASMLRAFEGRPWTPHTSAGALAKWSDWNARWLEHRAAIPAGRFLELPYADACAAPAASFARICEFLSLTCTNAYLEFVTRETHAGATGPVRLDVDGSELSSERATLSAVCDELGYDPAGLEAN